MGHVFAKLIDGMLPVTAQCLPVSFKSLVWIFNSRNDISRLKKNKAKNPAKTIKHGSQLFLF